ncbi:hypothetical protein C1645_877107 [Glomus cerebriforme]|uniref:Serine-threonine/tyrosine-protein kinase catalytic domain-containing protein n=1 Tax=Glomus cerebriforme TaxID=658196 RepID=A0A397T0Z7_9GLOM|nr:hypothetical protein C1645_877107 [Glomus cerebriforme]
MKKCWDTDPSKRPTIIELRDIISQWLICVNEYYEVNSISNKNTRFIKVSSDIVYQFRNDAYEFIEAKALAHEQVDTSNIQFHPQACYTCRAITEISDQKDFGSLESCAIKDEEE